MFSKSVRVSVMVSKLGCSELIFVEPGVKVVGAYYRDVLLLHQMLPAIRHLAGDKYVFQQDSMLAHHARATVEYLCQTTLEFISPDLWLPNRPDLNLIAYKIWGCVQEHVYQKHDVDQLKQCLVSRCGLTCSRHSLMWPLANGGRDSGPAYVPRDINLNICFNFFTLSVVC